LLPPGVALAADASYWRLAAALVLEALAAQKLAPMLVPADATGRTFHARWLPVMDGPKDAPRLARLEAAMPPVCRAEAGTDQTPVSPRALLDAFVKTTADALARQWGRPAVPHLRWDDAPDPIRRWLAALFSYDPTVDISPAQLQALAHSQRAWLRALQAAGDAAFRIAFRLEAPLQQAAAAAPLAGVSTHDWQLHYLLQARDDPSLLVRSETVW
jgi:hypothetical protein